MEEAAVFQSEVVSRNIQREPADFELLPEEQNRLVMKIRATREELAERRSMITALKGVPKRN